MGCDEDEAQNDITQHRMFTPFEPSDRNSDLSPFTRLLVPVYYNIAVYGIPENQLYNNNNIRRNHILLSITW